MIRHQQGDDFLLITQHDHAVAAATLAEAIGNERFVSVGNDQRVLDGIRMHDSGWPLHDDAPTLHRSGLPLNVLETSPQLASEVWSESVRRAAERHPYGGLLVSLHVLRLSALSQAYRAKAGRTDPRDLFTINQFQHGQIELQEQLRRKLGLRVDLPLALGLAPTGVSREEDDLLFHFGYLKLMDAIILDVCSSTPVFKSIEGIYPRPASEPVKFHLSHAAEFALSLTPWPFGASSVTVNVPCRRARAGTFSDIETFRTAYSAAEVESVTLRIVPADEAR